ncbi:unnamed protein product [Allacma fusca]|uniref:Uncharacterized protein n=1 Tax=Allacma fusca TaxID=39272 RepID=A0A8J2KPY8_9HEXA|nr:unnamed protein product [Allacma fusca]
MGEPIRAIIYPLALGLIKLWKAFTYSIIYVFEKPLKSLVKKELQEAGIEFNGKALQDIQIHNEMFYRRFAQDELLGFAEAYMDGWIDIDSIDEFFNRIFLQGLYQLKYFQFPWNKICHYLEYELFNNQTAKRSFEVGQKHYDLGEYYFVEIHSRLFKTFTAIAASNGYQFISKTSDVWIYSM